LSLYIQKYEIKVKYVPCNCVMPTHEKNTKYYMQLCNAQDLADAKDRGIAKL
jgi:hypothetical protein